MPREPATNLFAPESMGAYARPAVQWLEGTYLTLRPSFSEPGAVFAYLTSIAWDDDKGAPRLQRGLAHRQRV